MKENAEGQMEMSNEILAMLSPEKEHVPLTKVGSQGRTHQGEDGRTHEINQKMNSNDFE